MSQLNANDVRSRYHAINLFLWLPNAVGELNGHRSRKSPMRFTTPVDRGSRPVPSCSTDHVAAFHRAIPEVQCHV